MLLIRRSVGSASDAIHSELYLLLHFLFYLVLHAHVIWI